MTPKCGSACTEVAAIFTLSVPRGKSNGCPCSSPHEFWGDAGRCPLETQVRRRGVQLAWSSLSGTQTSPRAGALWKESGAVTLMSHGDQGIVSRLPCSSTPCRLPSRPWGRFWVCRASGQPVDRFIANVGTSAPAWRQSSGWQQGGHTLQPANSNASLSEALARLFRASTAFSLPNQAEGKA